MFVLCRTGEYLKAGGMALLIDFGMVGKRSSDGIESNLEDNGGVGRKQFENVFNGNATGIWGKGDSVSLYNDKSWQSRTSRAKHDSEKESTGNDFAQYMKDHPYQTGLAISIPVAINAFVAWYYLSHPRRENKSLKGK